MSAIADPAQVRCCQGLREVAELYGAQAIRLHRLIHLHVQAPDALVEDACQVAWLRLVRHRARVDPETADRWLVRVAVNEARRQITRAGRDVSLDELADAAAEEPGTNAELVHELAERRARLATLHELPERQRRLLWLQGLGFSYVEMSRATGESPRTVERQLMRAKRALERVTG